MTDLVFGLNADNQVARVGCVKILVLLSQSS